MPKEEQMTLDQILEYIWVPIAGACVALWTRLHGHGTRLALLEQNGKHHEQQRIEERKLRDSQRLEIANRLESHHKVVMTKLDHMEQRINSGSQ